jgi:processive 1,2-diacylglycerol beta-glucosyltransferase
MKGNALRFAKPTASATTVDTLLEERLPPLSFTKNQRATIALAVGPE